MAREKRYPTPAEFRGLVLGLDQPYTAIVALAGLGGLRRGELAPIRWNDLSGNRIRVDEAVYRGRLSSPKSTKSKRTVVVPEKGIELVDDWRSRCRFTEPVDFAFSIRTKSPPDLNRALERVIKARSEQLGLPRFSWHDFRHACTTWGRQARAQAEIMRDQVGHASVLMTQDIYSHLDDHDGAAKKIGDFVVPDEPDEEDQAAYLEP